MNTYSIFNKRILEWLLVASYLPSLGSNRQKISALQARTFGSQLLGHPVLIDTDELFTFEQKLPAHQN